MANLSNINGKFVIEQATGYVGIGITDPSQLLHLQSTADTILKIDNITSGTGKSYLLQSTTAGSFVIRDEDASSNRLLINTSGNATFAGDVTVTGGDLTLGTDSIASNINAVGDVLGINVDSNTGGGAGANIQLKTAGTTQLTINNSSSTFAGNISVTGTSFLDGDVTIGDTNSAFIGMARAGANYIAATNASGELIFRTAGSTPALTLDTNQNATFASAVWIPDYIYHVGDANSKFGFSGNDTFVINTSGTTALTIDASRNATFTATVTAPTFSGDLNGTINTVTTATTKGNSTNDTTVATTAFVQNVIGTIPAGLVFQGTWNASTNSPTLTSGSGTTGNFYIVSVAGSTNLDGITDWQVGDWAVFIEQGASDQWEKIDNSSVLSGSGTGGSFAGWSGSGTSVTLGNAPVTFSGNNSTFAGAVTVKSGNKLILNRPNNGVASEISTDASGTMILNSVNDEGFKFQNAGTTFLTLDTSDNATFAGNITFGDSHFIGDDGSDNLLIQGSAGENIIIDSADDIILDADGGDIVFKDAGTAIGRFKNNSGNFVIKSEGSDDDIIFKGNDGGSEITALTLDMSEGGNATFAGNVGIGITPSASFSGVEVLQLGKGMTLMGNTNDDRAAMMANLYLDSGTAFRYVMDGLAGKVAIEDGIITFGTAPSGTAGAVATVTERMRIDSSGQITNTMSGGKVLTDTNGFITSFQTLDTATAGGRYKGKSNRGLLGQIRIEQTATGADGGYISFDTSPNGSTTPTAKMRIKSNGKVGIGTENAQNAELAIKSGSNVDLELFSEASGTAWQSYNRTSSSWGYIRFIAGGGEQMRIHTNGNVGIGVTDPQAKLEVKGASATPADGNEIISVTNTTGGSKLLLGVVENSYGWIQAAEGGTLRNLLLNPTGGNVGIGTTSPGDKLNVHDSSANANLGIKITRGSQTHGLRLGVNDSHAFLWTTENQDLVFATNDSQRLTIQAGGNVGIGTTGPVQPLTVAGNVLFRTTTADNFENRFQFIVGGSGDPGNFYVYNDTESPKVRLNAGGDSYFVGGDVGIGETSPSQKLNVRDDGGSDVFRGIEVHNNNQSLARAGIAFQCYDWVQSAIWHGRSTTAAYGGALVLGTNPNTSDLSVGGVTGRMWILNNGNVGIGTASPTNPLSVEATNASDWVAEFKQGHSTAGQSYGVNIFGGTSSSDAAFQVCNQAGSGLLRVTGAGNVGIGDTSPTSISANTNSLSVNSSRTDLSGGLISKANGTVKHQQYWDSSGYNFVLNSGNFKFQGGNVGIGNTSPQTTLHVGTTTTVTNQFTNQVNASNFFVNGNANGGASFFQCKTAAVNINMMGNNDFACNQFTFYHKPLSTSQNVVGTIATFSSSTQYNTTSDYRLKENVIPLSDSIIRLKQLKPSRFNFIEDPERTMDGFLAHEVQNTVPEAVNGEKDAVDENGNEVHQGIDQAKLVPLLVAAVQEQQEIIESLKQRIEQLEN